MIRAYLQRWIDRKTHEIQQVNEKCRHIIALSQEPDIKIGEFYQRVEAYLAEEQNEEVIAND